MEIGAPRLSIRDAATQLGVPESTMRYWRRVGKGPKSYAIGRLIFYDVADLNAFLAQNKEKGRLDEKINGWVVRRIENATPLTVEQWDLVRRILGETPPGGQ